MHIVIDSNILVEQGFGNSALMGVLLSTSGLLEHQIIIPQLVIEEVTAKFRRELIEDTKEVRKVAKRLSQLLSKSAVYLDEELDPESETANFRVRLKERLDEAGTVFLDYPETKHSELVKRAVSRSRPFDSQGSGYRDSLIWESVAELAHSVDGEVILLSSDKAFSNQKGELHPDLVNDLNSRGVPQGKVTLVSTLGKFLDEHVKPRLDKIFWDEPVNTLQQFGFDLEDELGLALQGEYAGVEWYPSQLELPGEYETLYLDMAERLSKINVANVSQLPKNKYLVTVKADVDCTFDVFIFKGDFYLLDDPDLFVWDSDWNDHYVAAGKSLQLQCTFDLVVDTSSMELNGIEVTSAEPLATT